MAKLIYAALTSLDGYVADEAPVIVGGGNPCFPAHTRVRLELLDRRGFDNGMIHVRYRATT